MDNITNDQVILSRLERAGTSSVFWLFICDPKPLGHSYETNDNCSLRMQYCGDADDDDEAEFVPGIEEPLVQ